MIDFHVHPLIDSIIDNEGILESVQKIFYWTNKPEPIDTLLSQMELAKIDKAVLLPIDCTTTYGCKLPSNEAVSKLVNEYPDKFVGFGSVDPHKKDAVKEISDVVESMGLRGLKLSPPLQKFSPNDFTLMSPIYKKIEELDVPVVIHSGMFWQFTEKLSISKPILFDEVALKHPNLKIVLSHFGFPWIWEATVVIMKHPNIYVDLANPFTTTPFEHFELIFNRILGKRVVESCIEKKILFGSCFPRIEIDKMVKALKRLPLEEKTINRIFSENAKTLLKM